MLESRNYHKIVFEIVIVAAALVLPSRVLAAAPNINSCEQGATCTVGEFLYDDSYAPITTASCTLTTRNPSGTLIHNGVSMTSKSDGWYEYKFTAPSSNGLYRSQICCTAGTDYLCLDKSFSIVTAAITKADVEDAAPNTSEISEAVWGYSSRTLSSFGSLVSNIWSNSSRNLTGEKLNTSSLATKKEVEANRLLLEELVNKPIIENFLEIGDDIPDLSKKFNKTDTIANNLYVHTQHMVTKNTVIASRSDRYKNSELATIVEEMNEMLGNEDDSSSQDTIFGQINWLKEQWGFDVVEQLYGQAKISRKTLSILHNQIDSSNSSLSVRQSATQLLVINKKLELLIGDVSDTALKQTVYGKVQEAKDLAQALDSYSGKANSILKNWKTLKTGDKQKNITSLTRKFAVINKVPQVRKSILSPNISSETTDKELKNNIFAVLGLVEANKQLLTRKAGSSFANTWLELGSIVLKSLITNPSELISQTVPLKLYLPPEVREEHIIDKNEGLKVEYDEEKDQYYVAGEFTLKPGESITVSTKIEDIWIINNKEIESLRTQAEELAKPLEKTSFFAQSATLTTDINAALDRVLVLKETGVTPEAIIRSHREAQIELSSVKEKMSKLQDLVTQAGSAGTLTGFIGGAQAIAVWGLIIIMGAGFAFLALYMRVLRPKELRNKKKLEVKKKKVIKVSQKAPEVKHENAVRRRSAIALTTPVLMLILTTGLVSAVGSSLLTRKIVMSSMEQTANKEPKLAKKSQDEKILGKETKKSHIETDDIKIIVPLGSSVNLRKEPSDEGEVLSKFQFSTPAKKLDEKGKWVKVSIEDEETGKSIIEGWVHSDFVEVVIVEMIKEEDDSIISDSSNDVEGNFVTIEVPAGSSLNLREEPSLQGAVIAKLKTTTEALEIDVDGDWIQISIENNKSENGALEGWVHGDFVTSSVDNVTLSDPEQSRRGAEESRDSDFDAETEALINSLTSIGGLALINDTPTGWLRVRTAPWGSEIGRVNPGESYTVVSKKSNWIQIELEDGEYGWISSQYASVE